jgi:hypothetical protein
MVTKWSFGLQKITASVDLLDINDNSPKFERNSIRISIPEFSSTSTLATESNNSTFAQLPLPTAFDPDSPMNGLMGYQLLPTNASNLFRLRSDDNQLLLEVIKPLDRETCASYSLQVRDAAQKLYCRALPSRK